MSEEQQRQRDPWAIPTLLMWLVFMLIGLIPDTVFEWLREASGVLTQSAFINSPGAITVALSVFYGFFVYNACREAGVDENEASGKAVQAGLIGLPAFLPFPLMLILQTGEILSPDLRMVVYIAVPMKLLCWLYLLSLLFRYYALGNHRVYADMMTVFPSARPADGGGEDTSEETGETPEDEDDAPGEPAQLQLYQDTNERDNN